MSPAKSALGVFRFLTPGQLAICLVLFFLPWVEIQCPVPDLGNLGKNMGNPNAPAPKLNPKDMKYTPLITQSGLQAATGDYTIADPMMRDMVAQGKKAGGQQGKDNLKAAPMLFLFPAAALAGVVLGLVLPGGSVRKFVLVLCCGLALASAATQAVVGFPITEEVKKDPEFAGGGKNNDLGDMRPEDMIKTVYKFPFYLALLFAAGGLVTTFIEPATAPKPKRPAYEDEEDDDRDRDGDDRPRRGKRPESDNPFENMG